MTINRKAVDWVQAQFEGAGSWDSWGTADYWAFIEEFFDGGETAFVAKYSEEEEEEDDTDLVYRGEYGAQW